MSKSNSCLLGSRVLASCGQCAVNVLLEVLEHSSSPMSSLLVVEDAGELVLLESFEYSSSPSSDLVVDEGVGELVLLECRECSLGLPPSLRVGENFGSIGPLLYSSL